jgi:hypothetical protein
MKVKYIGESDPLELLNGKVYDVLEVDEMVGWYRVVDETGDDYLFPPESFEVVEEGSSDSKQSSAAM